MMITSLLCKHRCCNGVSCCMAEDICSIVTLYKCVYNVEMCALRIDVAMHDTCLSLCVTAKMYCNCMLAHTCFRPPLFSLFLPLFFSFLAPELVAFYFNSFLKSSSRKTHVFHSLATLSSPHHLMRN